MTAQHWRTIRLKLIQSGVGDPMALPTSHLLLDMTESLILESMQSNDPKADKAQRQEFIDALYKPVARRRGELPRGHKPPPPGFENMAGNEDAFDALTSVAR